MKKMTKAELEMKCRFLEERLEKIPKRELEIRCKVLEERMKRIYELCEKYTGISNAAETIGAIKVNCDPALIERSINWRI